MISATSPSTAPNPADAATALPFADLEGLGALAYLATLLQNHQPIPANLMQQIYGYMQDAGPGAFSILQFAQMEFFDQGDYSGFLSWWNSGTATSQPAGMIQALQFLQQAPVDIPAGTSAQQQSTVMYWMALLIGSASIQHNTLPASTDTYIDNFLNLSFPVIGPGGITQETLADAIYALGGAQALELFPPPNGTDGPYVTFYNQLKSLTCDPASAPSSAYAGGVVTDMVAFFENPPTSMNQSDANGLGVLAAIDLAIQTDNTQELASLIAQAQSLLNTANPMIANYLMTALLTLQGGSNTAGFESWWQGTAMPQLFNYMSVATPSDPAMLAPVTLFMADALNDVQSLPASMQETVNRFWSQSSGGMSPSQLLFEFAQNGSILGLTPAQIAEMLPAAQGQQGPLYTNLYYTFCNAVVSGIPGWDWNDAGPLMDQLEEALA